MDDEDISGDIINFVMVDTLGTSSNKGLAQDHHGPSCCTGWLHRSPHDGHHCDYRQNHTLFRKIMKADAADET
jgi:hypothetical protein